MSTAELKIDLINCIASTDEPGVIEELCKVPDFELEKETYQLTA